MFAILQSVYAALTGTWLERFVIDRVTVQPAAWVIGLVDPAAQVWAAGPRLRAAGGGIGVRPGCEGADIAFLLIAAMAVAPVRVRQRVIGAFAGIALAFVLNQARVISLFYAFRFDRALFQLLHGTVAPLLVILGAGTFFVLWLSRSTPGFGSEKRHLRASSPERLP